MAGMRRSFTASVLLVVAWTGFLAVPASAGPEGQMTIARTESTAARWFDPAEAGGMRSLLSSRSYRCGDTWSRLASSGERHRSAAGAAGPLERFVRRLSDGTA
jgi:hypothetical protein